MGDAPTMTADEYGLKGEKEDLIMRIDEDLVLEKATEVLDKGKLLRGPSFADVMLVTVLVKDDLADDPPVVKE